ncbi:DEAD/DEAH box helicase [Rhodococcus sp. Eu-32]|nr:DEAD/DEAH box helicase [Rhodococcus sp. Eu-32]
MGAAAGVDAVTQVATRSEGLREWQKEAFDAWVSHGYRAIVEAVTGTGKTHVGLAATLDSVSRGRQVMVVVPSVDLLEQWYSAMVKALPSVRIGRRGNNHSDTFRYYDVLITTIQSAVRKGAPLPRTGALLVADEVHRYGAGSYAKVLMDRFDERLGLTATLERQDDGVDSYLMPYFENLVKGCDAARGRRDGILAPVRVMTVAVPFTAAEATKFADLDEKAKSLRNTLIFDHGCAAEPFGEFMKTVVDLSKDRHLPASRVASRYLSAFSKRRALLADCEGKLQALVAIAPGLAKSKRSIVFSETKESAAQGAEVLKAGGLAAHQYSSHLDRVGRTRILKQFRSGELTSLVAPRVLDEGIDVPAVDVGVIIASSSSKRQMIQRMGRILRLKPDGRPAAFVIMYVAGTNEDPNLGAHEAFLDELTNVAEQVVDVDLADAGAVLASWLDQSAPVLPELPVAPKPIEPIVIPQSKMVPTTVSAPRTRTVKEILLEAQYGTPDQLDGILRCLAAIDVREASVLIRRYGIDGAKPRTVSQVAAEMSLKRLIIDQLEKRGMKSLEREAPRVLTRVISG